MILLPGMGVRMGDFGRKLTEINSHKPPATTARPRRWNALDLVTANIPEPDCFWGGIVARQTITLLIGRRSAGKTYFSLSWAGSIALARMFGYLATHPGKVLYLSQEMAEPGIRKRLAKLFTTAELRALGDRLIIVCRESIDLTTDEGADYLAALITEVGADVVFIDALRDVKGSYKENSNDEMGVLMVRLRDRVATKTNAAIILIHHKGKPREDGQEGGGRGASVIEDVSADIIYLHDPKDGSGRRSGKFEKTRDGELEGQEFSYELVDDDETNTLQVQITSAEVTGEMGEIRKLGDFVCARGTATLEEIRKEFSWGVRTARKYLKKAVEAGRLERVSGPGETGVYGPRNRLIE